MQESNFISSDAPINIFFYQKTLNLNWTFRFE